LIAVTSSGENRTTTGFHHINSKQERSKMAEKFAVKLEYPNGKVAYLSHNKRTAWCLKTAKKHAAEFQQNFPKDVKSVTVEPN